MATIILDAGHGGNDTGDAYGFRYEKNDNLRLTLAVGNELEKYGYNVEYIRVTDIYLSQNDRVNIANSLSGCLLLSIHRMIGELILSEAGLGFYLKSSDGIEATAANNIARELLPLGFTSYSLTVILDLPLLNATNVPSIMMGIGNLNSDYDNYSFDNRLNEFAAAIAYGIFNTIPLDSYNLIYT